MELIAVTIPTCTGECCRQFPVGGMDLEKIQDLGNALEDGEYIGAMLIPLQKKNEYGQPLFACRHWDSNTHRCMEYEKRPRMCSRFPYEGRCLHCGGTGPDYVDPKATQEAVLVEK